MKWDKKPDWNSILSVFSVFCLWYCAGNEWITNKAEAVRAQTQINIQAQGTLKEWVLRHSVIPG